MEEKKDFFISNTQHYVVEGCTFYGDTEDCQEAGSLDLHNLCAGETENYTIWNGDEDGTRYYVCLPTGEVDDDGDEELEVYDIDTFGIHIAPFSQLSKIARFSAVQQLQDVIRTTGGSLSLLQAYRTLKKEEIKHLYEHGTGLLVS